MSKQESPTPATVYNVALTRTHDGAVMAKLVNLRIAECEGENTIDAYCKLALELEVVAGYLEAKAMDLREAVKDAYR